MSQKTQHDVCKWEIEKSWIEQAIHSINVTQAQTYDLVNQINERLIILETSYKIKMGLISTLAGMLGGAIVALLIKQLMG